MAYRSYDDIASEVDLENEDLSGSRSFTDLPQGYYLCEFEEFILKNKEEYDQFSITFRVVEDGVTEQIDDYGQSNWVSIPKTANRKVWKHYPIKDGKALIRFATDMTKFRGADRGVPLLDREYFTSSELVNEALEILQGYRIYIQADHKKMPDGTETCWYNIVGWDRAETIGLPE